MAYLLIVILADLKRLPELLQAWQDIGVPGVTILEGAGAYRATTWLARVGRIALDRLMEPEEVRRRVLLAAIDDEKLLEQAIAEAERVINGFDRPDSGVLMVLPLSQVEGVRKVRREALREPLPSAVHPEWLIERNTPIEEVTAVLNLQPVVVREDTPLDEVANAMLAQPNVHVACVVAEDGRLVGLLDLVSLADDLFFHILPEEFMSEATDLEQAMRYADKSRMRTAADAMAEPVWVKRGETVKDAFKRMHEHRLTGLPLVDERYRVVGFVSLLELLATCLQRKKENTHVEERT